MTQAKVIITETTVYVTGYAKDGATILFEEKHNAPIEYAHNSDAVVKARSVAYSYQNMCITQSDATRDDVLNGKFNNRFM